MLKPQPRQRLNKMGQSSTATAVAKRLKTAKTADDRGYSGFNRYRGWGCKIRDDSYFLAKFTQIGEAKPAFISTILQ